MLSQAGVRLEVRMVDDADDEDFEVLAEMTARTGKSSVPQVLVLQTAPIANATPAPCFEVIGGLQDVQKLLSAGGLRTLSLQVSAGTDVVAGGSASGGKSVDAKHRSGAMRLAMHC